MNCPLCGYLMNAFDTDCARCHGKGVAPAPQVQVAPVAPPAPQQTAPSHYSRFCPHCATGMSAVMTICPNCHKKNTSPAAVAPASNANFVQVGVLVGAAVIGVVFLRASASKTSKPDRVASAPVVTRPVVIATPMPVAATPTPNPKPQASPVRKAQPVAVTRNSPPQNATGHDMVEDLASRVENAGTKQELAELYLEADAANREFGKYALGKGGARANYARSLGAAMTWVKAAANYKMDSMDYDGDNRNGLLVGTREALKEARNHAQIAEYNRQQAIEDEKNPQAARERKAQHDKEFDAEVERLTVESFSRSKDPIR